MQVEVEFFCGGLFVLRLFNDIWKGWGRNHEKFKGHNHEVIPSASVDESVSIFHCLGRGMAEAPTGSLAGTPSSPELLPSVFKDQLFHLFNIGL